MAISGMFGTRTLLGTILNQAAHDDKPPVIHGSNEKNVSYDSFKDKTHNMFFNICNVKYHTSLCFYDFMNAPLSALAR
jgi:hypothetical protein